MNELDTASLILRLALGVTLIAHGWNHGFGPGGLKGTPAGSRASACDRPRCTRR